MIQLDLLIDDGFLEQTAFTSFITVQFCNNNSTIFINKNKINNIKQNRNRTLSIPVQDLVSKWIFAVKRHNILQHLNGRNKRNGYMIRQRNNLSTITCESMVFLGHDFTLLGYTGPGTAWASKINFWMQHAPDAGSII